MPAVAAQNVLDDQVDGNLVVGVVRNDDVSVRPRRECKFVKRRLERHVQAASAKGGGNSSSSVAHLDGAFVLGDHRLQRAVSFPNVANNCTCRGSIRCQCERRQGLRGRSWLYATHSGARGEDRNRCLRKSSYPSACEQPGCNARRGHTRVPTSAASPVQRQDTLEQDHLDGLHAVRLRESRVRAKIIAWDLAASVCT